jgi:hypothetical protein
MILSFRLVLIKKQSLWVKTGGEVISFAIQGRSYGTRLSSLQKKMMIKFLKIRYKFKVGEHFYESKRVSMDFVDKLYSDDELKTDALLCSIYENNIQVYYFKYWPNLSILSSAYNKGDDCLALIIVLLFVMLASAMIVYWI